MMTMKYAILYTEHVLQRGIITMAHAIPITISGKIIHVLQRGMMTITFAILYNAITISSKTSKEA